MDSYLGIHESPFTKEFKKNPISDCLQDTKRNSKKLNVLWMSAELVSSKSKQDTRRRDTVQNHHAINPDIEEATINMLQPLLARHNPTGYDLIGRALFCGTLRSTSALSNLSGSLDCSVLICITLLSFAF